MTALGLIPGAAFTITAENARGELLAVDGDGRRDDLGGTLLDWALEDMRSGITADGTRNRVAVLRVSYADRVAVLRRDGDTLVDVETGRELRRASLAWSLVNGRDLTTNAPRYGATADQVAAYLDELDRRTAAPTAAAAAAPAPAPVVEAPADPAPAAVEPPAVLVVVPCGRKKLPQAAPAADLYVGNRLAQQAAATIAARTPGARVVILSALHGLVDLADVIAPYDVTMGDPDAIAPAELAAQLAATGARRVIALTPKAYSAALAAACRVTGAELVDHLAGSRGLPEQRGRLARLRDAVAEQPAESAPAVELPAPATVGPDLARFVARARGRQARIAPAEQLALFAA